jgi:hypothetical protein
LVCVGDLSLDRITLDPNQVSTRGYGRYIDGALW